MAPKRKGTAKAAAKSRKAKADEKAQEEPVAPAAPESPEDAKAENKEAELVEAEPEEIVAKAEDDVKQEEKKIDDSAPESKDEEKIEDKAVVKEEKVAKSKGRKKKEAAPLVPGTKRVTRSNPGPRDDTAKEEEAKKASSKVHIIIEHCKQCTSFKTRAVRAQSFLLEAQPNLKISINPEKPRKGCFEIRDDTGRIFVSLQDLTRPFTKLKELDLEEISEDILKQIE